MTSLRRRAERQPIVVGTRRVIVAAGIVFAVTMIGLGGSSACAEISDAETSDAALSDAAASKAELVELSETLKAAVLSGALSETDAFQIYVSLESRISPNQAKQKSKATKDDGDEGYDGPFAAKGDLLRLAAPLPGDVATLLEPELLRRDAERLGQVLDLDRDQMAVVDVLLSDYLESYELVTAPLREALTRYQRTRTDRWIAATLARVEVGDVDEAVARTREAIQQFDAAVERKTARGEAKPDAEEVGDDERIARSLWAQRMIGVTATMERRLGALRERVEDRLTDMDRTGAPVTADDLVRMARELRAERRRLRATLTETLSLVAGVDGDETERARFEQALARVRVEHGLRHGRIGGERTNLWSALAETRSELTRRRGIVDGLYAAAQRLAEAAPRLAAALDARTDATLDREIGGLAYLAERDRLHAATSGAPSDDDLDLARLTTAMRPFANAARREVTASIAVRDELLALLDDTAELVTDAYPDTRVATTYCDAAWRRGFRSDMRSRWSERALATAIQRDGLDDDAGAKLATLARKVDDELRAMRASAIEARLQRDPARARAQIDTQLASPASYRPELDLDEILGHDYEAYVALDGRTESELTAILSPEQMAELPPRPQPIMRRKWKKK